MYLLDQPPKEDAVILTVIASVTSFPRDTYGKPKRDGFVINAG
jgi:hypothetical protein